MIASRIPSKILSIILIVFLNSQLISCLSIYSREDEITKISSKGWPDVDFMVLSPSEQAIALTSIGDKDFSSIQIVDLVSGRIDLIAKTEPYQGILYVSDWTDDEKEILLWTLSGKTHRNGSWLVDLSDVDNWIWINEYSNPSLTADGKLISIRIEDGQIYIYIADGITGTSELIYSTSAVTIKGYAVSPSGKELIIAIKDRSGSQNDIVLIDLESAGTKTLELKGNNSYPDWSPSGRYVVYSHSSNDGSEDGLLIQDLRENCESTITFQKYHPWNPLWVDNGTAILFIHLGEVYKFDISSRFIDSMPDNWNICDLTFSVP